MRRVDQCCITSRVTGGFSSFSSQTETTEPRFVRHNSSCCEERVLMFVFATRHPSVSVLSVSLIRVSSTQTRPSDPRCPRQSCRAMSSARNRHDGSSADCISICAVCCFALSFVEETPLVSCCFNQLVAFSAFVCFCFACPVENGALFPVV